MIRLFEAIKQRWTGTDPALTIGKPQYRFTGHDESKHRSALARRHRAEELKRESAAIASGAESMRRIQLLEKVR